MIEQVKRMPRMLLDAVWSIRMSKEFKNEFHRVALQVRMTPQDAARYALWQFMREHEDSDERPEF